MTRCFFCEPSRMLFERAALKCWQPPVLKKQSRSFRHREPVDLLVLDVKLPGKSGLELLRESVRRGFKGKAVVMTAFDNPDSERVCRTLVRRPLPSETF